MTDTNPEKIPNDVHAPQMTWAEETGIRNRPPRVLLTSVFGPFARDDEFGSRKINPMELFHNQVTRAEGAYSIRMFYHSLGIRMIQANINAPSAILDYPTLKTFENELISHSYDIIGISAIIVNVRKVREMCRIIRRLSPQSKIVVGGHVAAIPGLERMIDADHIVKGEGISWMRRYLGENDSAQMIHPPFLSSFGNKVMGIPIPEILRSPSATIIPSVGCPMGCNFCTTSAFFGGKGKSVNFYKTGSEIFQVMCDAESSLKVQDFFIMDENFLLNRKRAMEMLGLMKANNKSWSLFIFSSANALQQYTMKELVELGVSYVWIGLESIRSKYAKLEGSDTLKLVRELQSHGIALIGSTIIGLEHHTPENIRDEVERAIAHNTDFHQFMLYTPLPGTPLYAEVENRDELLNNVDLADIHGQYKFNFRHAAISRDDSERYLDMAFRLDFEQNGPSIYRVFRTTFEGWMRHKNTPDPRVRKRFERGVLALKIFGNPALWAMERSYKNRDATLVARISSLRVEIEKEFGLLPYLTARLLGPVLVWTTRREEERLARGVTYEPRTFIERKNWS